MNFQTQYRWWDSTRHREIFSTQSRSEYREDWWEKVFRCKSIVYIEQFEEHWVLARGVLHDNSHIRWYLLTDMSNHDEHIQSQIIDWVCQTRENPDESKKTFSLWNSNEISSYFVGLQSFAIFIECFMINNLQLREMKEIRGEFRIFEHSFFCCLYLFERDKIKKTKNIDQCFFSNRISIDIKENKLQTRHKWMQTVFLRDRLGNRINHIIINKQKKNEAHVN